ncbi:MAG: putative membrane protein [Cellvibrionaceae bacterium]
MFKVNIERGTILSQRLLWVDALRGLAIILMAIFHFCYDLRYFGYVDWDIPNGSNWWPFRYFIISLFVFTVGVSLTLAHTPHFRRINFIQRLTQLLLAAVAITIMSLFMFPKAWIYFGILHFIVLASLIGVLLIRIPLFTLIFGLSIIVSYWFGLLPSDWPFNYFSEWLPNDTEDYVPLFPWIGVMFLGVGFGGTLLPKIIIKSTNKKYKNIRLMDIPKNNVTSSIAWLGKHGLLIYIIHQPVFFSSFYVIYFFNK